MLYEMVEMDCARAQRRDYLKLVFIHFIVCKVQSMYDDITTKIE